MSDWDSVFAAWWEENAQFDVSFDDGRLSIGSHTIQLSDSPFEAKWAGSAHPTISLSDSYADLKELLDDISMQLFSAGTEAAEDGGAGSWDDSVLQDEVDFDMVADKHREQKRAWAEKEKHVRENLLPGAKKTIANNIFDPKEISLIVTNQLIEFLDLPESSGIVVTPIDDFVYHWSIELYPRCFPSSSRLFKELTRSEGLVTLTMHIPMDIFPYYPPEVYLVTPRMLHGMSARVTCMPELDTRNWKPTVSLRTVINRVIELLGEAGEIDPDDSSAYSALEGALLKLRLLVMEPPKCASEPAKPKGDASASTDPYGRSKAPKGTGYSSGADFDAKAAAAVVEKREMQLNEVCTTILLELSNNSDRHTLPLVEECGLLPFLRERINFGSLPALESHPSLYATAIGITRLVLKLDGPLNKRATALAGPIQIGCGLFDGATRLGVELAPDLQTIRRHFTECAQLVASHVSEEKKDTPMTVDEEYVNFMREHSLELVEEESFAAYRADFKALPGSRDAKRINSEISQLHAQMPIHVLSSALVRVLARDKTQMMALIFPADDTPYAFGSFVFHIKLHSGFPNEPPKVMLDTTGAGTVRFNPNLYHNGKVCLSLLGTWAGSNVWKADVSSLAQVIISIQSLIFIPDPYFNEPGYEGSMGTPEGKKQSDAYNHNLRYQTIVHAILGQIRNPPPEFKEVIHMHYKLLAPRVVQKMTEWRADDPRIGALIDQFQAEVAKL